MTHAHQSSGRRALTTSILPTALAIPSTNSVVHGYRIAMMPDRLLGRAESMRSMISPLIAPLGPLVAGVLLGASSARATIAAFAGFGLVLDELDHPSADRASTATASTAPPD